MQTTTRRAPPKAQDLKSRDQQLRDMLPTLNRMTYNLEPPLSLFNGLQIKDSASPDNIIIFKRTDTSAFKPEGVSNNFHHRFELVCALEGSGPVRIGANTYFLESGDCALIFPNQFHHYIDIASKRLNWLFITFEMPHAKVLDPLLNNPKCLDVESIILLQNTLSPYHFKKTTTPDTLEIAYHLSRFLRHMPSLPTIPEERHNPSTTDDPRDVVLEHINNYVRTHLLDTPTLTDLSNAIGYSVGHIRTIFRDRLGISLGRYIRESRLSEAAKLLQNTDLKITEISQRTGFDSLFAFSRAFKNTYGIPPKAYSKKVKAPS